MDWHNRYENKEWLENYNPIAIVTGVKEFSIGEAIALNLLKSVPKINIICISRNDNKNLLKRLGNQGIFISMDLNPLNYGSLDEFQNSLEDEVRKGIKHFENPDIQEPCGIDFLFNNSGVYDFGPLTKTPNESINNLIGVNYVGHVLTAKTVMALNEDRDFNNPKNFRLCEVGSFQGVDIRSGRPVYAPSKAVGIDFCQSLVRGNEVEMISYIAVGPVDTYMLHANHWSTKAGGDKEFIDNIFSNDAQTYKSIFIDGNQEAFGTYIAGLKKSLQTKLKETYSKYLEVRKKYAKTKNFATELADDVGGNIVKRMLQSSKDHPSDIVVYNKQWNNKTKTFFKGYTSRTFDPALEGGYDKLSSILGKDVDKIKWKEI